MSAGVKVLSPKRLERSFSDDKDVGNGFMEAFRGFFRIVRAFNIIKQRHRLFDCGFSADSIGAR